MGLERARTDMKRFMQAEWSTQLEVDDKCGTTESLLGIASKHHLGFDPENGSPVNTKNAHCSINEEVLTDAGFTVRNDEKEVAMIGWTVAYTDSSGNLGSYTIKESFPDETLGLIVCILGDHGC